MGRLCSALRAYALEYDDPAEVLSHLDAKIMHFEPGAMATALYAVSRPPFETMHLSSAGHFLPIVVRADGDVVQVEHPVNLPLGVDLDVRRTSSEIRLEPDGSLVMFTDGLIERRTRSTPRSLDVFDTIDSALDELRALLRTGDADRMASAVLDAMLTIEPPSDDVALLIVRRTTGRAEGG
jgi:serine phosphatase RsbU (regulator of sigma subunit)